MLEEDDGDGGGDRQVFAGVTYRLRGFDSPSLEQQYKSDIERRGGKAATRLNKISCSHLIICSETICYNDPFCVKARKDEIIVVNEHWVDDSVSRGALADPKRVLYWPLRELGGISGCLKLHICASGYSQDICTELRKMVDFMGASFYEDIEEWTDKGTHLICYKFEGHDYKLARQCKADVVNHKWLEDCLKEWRIVPIDNYTISGWELELIEVQAKGANLGLVFHATIRSPTLNVGNEEVHKKLPRTSREYSTIVFSPTNSREYKASSCRGVDKSSSNPSRRQCNSNTPETKEPSMIRQYNTPPSKTSSIDTNRKAFSTGTKRSKVQIEYDSTMKCKRALNYGSNSAAGEVTLHEYAKRGLTEYIRIPYIPNARKMAKEGIKLILLNAYELVLDLHSEDKSLKGLFSSRNILISLKSKKVVLQNVEVVPYTKVDGTADKSQFVIMVKDLFGEFEVTAEITGWLDCIAKGAHDNVLRRHVNMLHANNIFGEFCLMYHSLLKLRALDKDKYKALLKSLKCYDPWQLRIFNWCILEDNYDYLDLNAEEPEPTIYEDNVFGLVKLIRNCWEHPAKLYQEYLIAVLLGEYPKLLSDLQEALYAAGYLPQLDIKNLNCGSHVRSDSRCEWMK